MSPILVRPVREQLEHDRVIRQLHKDLARRKVEVAINPGNEQNVGLGSGARKEFPDAVLFSTEKGRRVLGVVEVETGESINYLEAMAEWGHYARLKAPLHLYVPIGLVDLARRLAADNNIPVAEFHSYHQIGDLIRFASVHRAPGVPALPPPDDEPAPPIEKAARKPAAPVRPTSAAKPASKAPSAPSGPARTARVASPRRVGKAGPARNGKSSKPAPVARKSAPAKGSSNGRAKTQATASRAKKAVKPAARPPRRQSARTVARRK